MKRIGYLGPKGTNSHEVAKTIIGIGEKLVPYTSFALGTALRNGSIDKAILPIENGGEGRVRWVLDLFANNNIGQFVIIGEVVYRVTHCLIGFGKKRKIKVVYSHPQALGQCRQTLGKLETRDTNSTSAAVKLMTQTSDVTSAAIGTKTAAKMYSVPIIQEDVGDFPNNETRFVVLGTKVPKPTGNDKTSLLFGLTDEVGALDRIISTFRVANINMTMIHSEPSPSRKLGEYIFFIDVNVHQNNKCLVAALNLIRATGVGSYKILGSYPKATLAENVD